jgi:hypothetical protein
MDHTKITVLGFAGYGYVDDLCYGSRLGEWRKVCRSQGVLEALLLITLGGISAGVFLSLEQPVD